MNKKWLLLCSGFFVISAVIFAAAFTSTSNDLYQTAEIGIPETGYYFDDQHPNRLEYYEAKKTKLVNIGRAPFGLASKNFRCEDFLNSLDDVNYLHIAWLFNTFGKKYD